METSTRIQYPVPPLWADWAPHQSQAAVPAVLPQRHSRRLRNEPANRYACSTVAGRRESKGSPGAITNAGRRGRLPIHARKIRRQPKSGLAAWQQIVVAAYLQKHIADSITVRALARFVYLGSQRFSRAFKRSFGIPPHRYVIQQRVERGKTLLTRSPLSISEIGLALGFSRTSSFSAAFQKVAGISPIEYRLGRQ